MTPKCAIQWIDCAGEPTPDDNPAIGQRVFVRPIRLGPDKYRGGGIGVILAMCCDRALVRRGASDDWIQLTRLVRFT